MRAPQYRIRPSYPIDPDWSKAVDYMRFHIMRTIDGIRNGHVEEIDLDKLNNYVLQSLALAEHAGQKAWAAAQLRAEYVSLLTETQVKEMP